MNKAILTSLGFLFFHLFLAYYFELIDDEAYYNLWSSFLSFGYYDHPPMIAWWIYAGKLVFGEAAVGVRLFACFAFFVVSILVARITLLLGGRDQIFISVILFNIMIPVMGLGFIATPDAPLILFWVGAFWATLEGLFRKNSWYWLIVGFFVALAILSKFNALFYVLGLFGWSIFSKRGRDELIAPLIWVGVGIGLIILLPSIYWNYENDWIGLEKQFGRLLNKTVGLYFLFEFLLSIVIFTTPLAFIFSILGFFKKFEFRSLVLWTHLPIFLYFLNHSLTERIQGNWIIMLFPLLAILTALGLKNVHIFWSKLTIFFGSFLTIFILILGMNPYFVVFSGDNPFNQMKGWERIKPEFQTHLNKAEWIAVTDYAMIGRVSWLLGSNSKVWALNEPYRYLFRDSFPSRLCNIPGVLVEKVNKKIEKNVVVEATDVPIVYISQSVGKTEIMGYRLTQFSKVSESEYCS